MQEPVVSVVMPLYNKERYVGRAVASVMAQTEGRLELLVIDDGSADAGPAAAKAAGDGRCRVLPYPNGGVSVARNRGVAAARAPLVAFLDADDAWEPGFLAAALGALARYPSAVAAFSNIAEEGYPQGSLPRRGGERLIVDYPRWFATHRGLGLWSSNTVCRKAALLAAGGFPPGVQNGEDTDTWMRLSFQGPVAYVPAALARYELGDQESLSKRVRAVRPRALESLEAELASGRLTARGADGARLAASYLRLAYAAALAQEGRRREALKEAAAARPRPALARAYARAAYALLTGR